MTEVQKFPVFSIIEAPWNVNVMEPEIFEKLLADLKTSGPEGTSPVHVASAEIISKSYLDNTDVKRVTIDGSHRLRAAKKLDWESINVIDHPEITTEEEARLFNYRMDIERGEIDQFKLAASFKWFSDNGFNHNVIAAKFGIDRTTVSKKLSLLNLDRSVLDWSKGQENLTVSHLEVIAPLDPKLQVAIANEIQNDASWRGGSVTVNEIAEVAKNAKRKLDERTKFDKALEKAKFPKCPKCGGKPAFDGWAHDLPFVNCSSRDWNHKWNLETGKGPRADPTPAFNPRTGDYSPSVAQHVKLTATSKDFHEASGAFLKELFPKIATIDRVGYGNSYEDGGMSGTLKSGERFKIGYMTGRFVFETKGQKIRFSYADVGKSTPAYEEGMRIRFTGDGFARKESALQEWEKDANEFLQKYGKVPRGKGKSS